MDLRELELSCRTIGWRGRFGIGGWGGGGVTNFERGQGWVGWNQPSHILLLSLSRGRQIVWPRIVLWPGIGKRRNFDGPGPTVLSW